ncbi:MAG: CAP domain-containing protein [Limisphaerales bacterium]
MKRSSFQWSDEDDLVETGYSAPGRRAWAWVQTLGLMAVVACAARSPSAADRLAGGLGEPVSASGHSPAWSLAAPAAVASFSHGDPTPQEQLMLELVNRARANPTAEALRLELDLNEGLEPETISPDPKPPLALHFLLIESSRAHSEWMVAEDVFSHFGVENSDPGDRMEEHGYPFSGSWTWGENVAWRGTSREIDITAFTRELHDGLFRSPGHRGNLMNSGFDEVGIGLASGVFSLEEDGAITDWNAVLATQNFAASDGTPGPLLLGVVFRDLDSDQFYDVDEGVSGIRVQLMGGTFETATSSSGGYAVPYAGTESIQVQFSGGSLTSPVTRSFVGTGDNVKIDLNLSAAGPLRILPESVQFDAEGHFRFEFEAPNSKPVTVEVSTAMETWQTVAMISPAGTTGQFQDSVTRPAPAFYRLTQSP